MSRSLSRKHNQIRNLTIETNIINSAEGSALIKLGNTHVICTASLDETVPHFIKNTGTGWISAEYGMIPRSTQSRMRREASTGKQTGRTQEIQRLIGRSLRAAVDLKTLGERQIIIDCDVINADGGTRTAAITGSYVALHLAIVKLISMKKIKQNPIIKQVCAISCGINMKNEAIVDLDYLEDSSAMVDANFVLSSDNGLIEVQSSAEKNSFSQEQLIEMLSLAKNAANQLFMEQNRAILSSKINII